MMFADDSPSIALEAMGSALLIFGVAAVWGIHLIYRGIHNDIFDSAGGRIAGRSWFIGGGAFLVAIFISFFLFMWRQGCFSS
jgi:hypothetical protein